MMRFRAIFIFLSIFLHISIRAQIPEAGHAVYTLSTSEMTFDCNLYFKGSLSAFFFTPGKSLVPISTSATFPLDQTGSMPDHYDQDHKSDLTMIKDYKSGTIISNEVLFSGDKAVVLDSIPFLDWAFHSERKPISGYICQQATTQFRCSQYTAWFTLDVPVGTGPWKMGGLPGLIVQLSNETVGLTYTLKELEYPLELPKTIFSFPTSKNPVYTFKQYGEIQKEGLKKIEVLLPSQTNSTSGEKPELKIPECFNQI